MPSEMTGEVRPLEGPAESVPSAAAGRDERRSSPALAVPHASSPAVEEIVEEVEVVEEVEEAVEEVEEVEEVTEEPTPTRLRSAQRGQPDAAQRAVDTARRFATEARVTLAKVPKKFLALPFVLGLIAGVILDQAVVHSEQGPSEAGSDEDGEFAPPPGMSAQARETWLRESVVVEGLLTWEGGSIYSILSPGYGQRYMGAGGYSLTDQQTAWLREHVGQVVRIRGRIDGGYLLDWSW